MSDKRESHALDASVELMTDSRDKTNVSNIPMANLSVHDLDILHQESFNSTKPNTGAIFVENKELEELDDVTFHSWIPTSNDRYEVFPPMGTIMRDNSLPGIIDISTIIETERGNHTTLTFENDVDFNLTSQSGCEFDIPDLSHKWKNPGAFTGYDEISDFKSGQSSDFSTEASSLLFNIWNEDYDGNPDPEILKKLIAAKHLPEGIDPAAEYVIQREKLLSQLRALEDDDSSLGSCQVLFQKNWLTQYFCGYEENSEIGSIEESNYDCMTLNDAKTEGSLSLGLEDLNFKRPKTSQYALVPDNQYRPGMETNNQELVLMLPKNATLTRYREVKNPYLPVHRVVGIDDEEYGYDKREIGAGYLEKEIEFTLQKYDSTPQRIAELVMKGKISEAKTYDMEDIMKDAATLDPIDLNDFIIKDRRIPFDDDYIEADRSIASTVEFQQDRDESSEGSYASIEDNLSYDSLTDKPELWNEEVVLGTLVPVGSISDSAASVLAGGGIVPLRSAESELTFGTSSQDQDMKENICPKSKRDKYKDKFPLGGDSVVTKKKKEKQVLVDYNIERQYVSMTDPSTSDTSISSAGLFSLDRLHVEKKQVDTLPGSNLSFEAESLEPEEELRYTAKLTCPTVSSVDKDVREEKKVVEFNKCTNNNGGRQSTTETDNRSTKEDVKEAKNQSEPVDISTEVKSCSSSTVIETVDKSSTKKSEKCLQSRETNNIIGPKEEVEIETNNTPNLIDSHDSLNTFEKDHVRDDADKINNKIFIINDNGKRTAIEKSTDDFKVFDTHDVVKTSSLPLNIESERISILQQTGNANLTFQEDDFYVVKGNVDKLNNAKENNESVGDIPKLVASVVTPSVSSTSEEGGTKINSPGSNNKRIIDSNKSKGEADSALRESRNTLSQELGVISMYEEDSDKSRQKDHEIEESDSDVVVKNSSLSIYTDSERISSLRKQIENDSISNRNCTAIIASNINLKFQGDNSNVVEGYVEKLIDAKEKNELVGYIPKLVACKLSVVPPSAISASREGEIKTGSLDPYGNLLIDSNKSIEEADDFVRESSSTPAQELAVISRFEENSDISRQKDHEIEESDNNVVVKNSSLSIDTDPERILSLQQQIGNDSISNRNCTAIITSNTNLLVDRYVDKLNGAKENNELDVYKLSVVTPSAISASEEGGTKVNSPGSNGNLLIDSNNAKEKSDDLVRESSNTQTQELAIINRYEKDSDRYRQKDHEIKENDNDIAVNKSSLSIDTDPERILSLQQQIGNDSISNRNCIAAIASSTNLSFQEDDSNVIEGYVDKLNDVKENDVLDACKISVVTPSAISAIEEGGTKTGSPGSNRNLLIDSNSAKEESDDLIRELSNTKNQELDITNRYEEEGIMMTRQKDYKTDDRVNIVPHEDEENFFNYENNADQNLIRWKRLMDKNENPYHEVPGALSACDTFLISASKLYAQRKKENDFHSLETSPKKKSKSVIGDERYRVKECFKSLKLNKSKKKDEKNEKIKEKVPYAVDMESIPDVLDITYTSNASKDYYSDAMDSTEISKLLDITFDETMSRDNDLENVISSNHLRKDDEFSINRVSPSSTEVRTIAISNRDCAFIEEKQVKTSELMNKIKGSSTMSIEQESINSELYRLKLSMAKKRSLSQNVRVLSTSKKMTDAELEVFRVKKYSLLSSSNPTRALQLKNYREVMNI